MKNVRHGKSSIVLLAFATLALLFLPVAADAGCGTRCVELNGCWRCELGLFFECHPSDPDFSNGFCFQSCDATLCFSASLDPASDPGPGIRIAAKDPASAVCPAPVGSDPEVTPHILKVELLDSRI